MWKTYANILGQHTAGILGRVTDGGPFKIQLLDAPRERPILELAGRIDFDGHLDNGRKKVGGYLVCGTVHLKKMRPLLADIAVHMNLDPAILETETGPQNILDEFLNIVTGLTGADWAEHGFAIDFSPPQILSGQTLPAHLPDEQTFHVVVSALNGFQVDILVAFNDRPR
jgi:hypothetical protein